MGGGSAGNNGIKSLIEAIGPDFTRWRIGIGRPSGQMSAADYVLQNFSSRETKQVAEIIQQAADSIEAALEHGHEATTQQLGV